MIRALVTLCALVAAMPAVGNAQRLQPEIRFETLGPRYQGLLGVALHVPAGRYVRVGLGGTGIAVGRTDLIARFTFDPYREMRWALSVGGGVSYDAELKELFLALHGDLEGPRVRGITPFASAGLAGGARFAVGVRRAFPNRR
jgi:hypothetical protein